jgi:hypothetical protein
VLTVGVLGVNHDHVRTVTRHASATHPSSLPQDEPTQPREQPQEPSSPSVPRVVDLPLDEAESALADAGFDYDIGAGGGVLGPLVDSNWVVTDQDPGAGAHAPEGTVVELGIARLSD